MAFRQTCTLPQYPQRHPEDPLLSAVKQSAEAATIFQWFNVTTPEQFVAARKIDYRTVMNTAAKKGTTDVDLFHMEERIAKLIAEDGSLNPASNDEERQSVTKAAYLLLVKFLQTPGIATTVEALDEGLSGAGKPVLVDVNKDPLARGVEGVVTKVTGYKPTKSSGTRTAQVQNPKTIKAAGTALEKWKNALSDLKKAINSADEPIKNYAGAQK